MTAPQINQLDFSLLPPLQTGSMFSALKSEIDAKLKQYPATYDRANGALSFSAKICNTPKANDGSNLKLREAFVRAALGEFVSMEEAVYYDAPNGNNGKIKDSRNPLLHMMKQLRNMQFHLMSSTLNTSKKPIVWASQESTITLWYVQDIAVSDFDRLRNANRYSASDKTQLISWFNSSQKEWGINQLILEAVNAYATEIVT
jgi:hypothetical protein